tara:strand:- start:928 stop:1098 length:171 start_codon:yes stop_codon:yes gene_type:complete
MERKKMNEWIIEVQGSDGWWKTFSYADTEKEARSKAAKAILNANLIYMVRFRRDLK